MDFWNETFTGCRACPLGESTNSLKNGWLKIKYEGNLIYLLNNIIGHNKDIK